MEEFGGYNNIKSDKSIEKACWSFSFDSPDNRETIVGNMSQGKGIVGKQAEPSGARWQLGMVGVFGNAAIKTLTRDRR
jgi:hypothetical protein